MALQCRKLFVLNNFCWATKLAGHDSGVSHLISATTATIANQMMTINHKYRFRQLNHNKLPPVTSNHQISSRGPSKIALSEMEGQLHRTAQTPGVLNFFIWPTVAGNLTSRTCFWNDYPQKCTLIFFFPLTLVFFLLQLLCHFLKCLDKNFINLFTRFTETFFYN